MSRFSCGVAPRTSVTCSSHDLPKIVTTGVSAATSSRRFGSSVGRVRAMAGRAESRELRVLPAQRPGRGEELDVLGVRARPAALDVRHAELVEHARDPQLVGERERDVLALGTVAQGRVVEDDRRVVALGHAGTPASSRRRSTAAVATPSSRRRRAVVARPRDRRDPPSASRRRARARPPPRWPRPHPRGRATAAAASPPTGSCRSGSPCPARRCPAPSRGSARTARTCRARSSARRATPRAACRASRPAPPPRPTGCRRTGSR